AGAGRGALARSLVAATSAARPSPAVLAFGGTFGETAHRLHAIRRPPRAGVVALQLAALGAILPWDAGADWGVDVGIAADGPSVGGQIGLGFGWSGSLLRRAMDA